MNSYLWFWFGILVLLLRYLFFSHIDIFFNRPWYISKILKIKSLKSLALHLVAFVSDNIEAWSCYAEANFHEYDMENL